MILSKMQSKYQNDSVPFTRPYCLFEPSTSNPEVWGSNCNVMPLHHNSSKGDICDAFNTGLILSKRSDSTFKDAWNNKDEEMFRETDSGVSVGSNDSTYSSYSSRSGFTQNYCGIRTVQPTKNQLMTSQMKDSSIATDPQNCSPVDSDLNNWEIPGLGQQLRIIQQAMSHILQFRSFLSGENLP